MPERKNTKARCTAKTKAGKPCKAPPITGTRFCLAHSPANTRESAGFIARNGKQGRPRLPTPTEIARKLIEDNVMAVLRPHFRTLGYEVELHDERLRLVEREGGPAKVYGESKDGEIRVSGYDDLGAMIAAAEKLLDRVYGRPTVRSEVKGDLTVTSQSEFDREVAELNAKLAQTNGHRKVKQRA